MKTAFTRYHGMIKLVIDDGVKKGRERDVLARMDLHEGTGCWRLNDIRLHRYEQPSPYACAGAGEDYWAHYTPESPAEAELVKSMLREYREDPDGTINWCSFEGIVRGHAEVKGCAPRYLDFDQAGFFSQAEGVAKMKEMQAFWDSYEGDPGKAKIDNPHRQPTRSQVISQIILAQMRSERECGVKTHGPSLG